MRKLTAIAAALAFLSATSLTPVFAASPGSDIDLSSAKKKAKAKGKMAKKKTVKRKKMSELSVADDLSAAKSKRKGKAKAKKASKKKLTELTVADDLSSAKGKRAKAKSKKAKKVADNVILYRIAA